MLSAMSSVLRKHKAAGLPLGLVVIDYLQLMGTNRRENRNIEIGELTRGLKKLLHELQIPGLVLSQLKRPESQSAADNPPQLSDLRDSGSIEQDADNVIFLHCTGDDKKLAERPMQLIVAKQRNGPIGEIDMVFKSAYTLMQPETRLSPNV
jgi:replicative DNA helicase